MKENLLRISALLIVLWYCFSVIGFNVHTCRASGESFVATVLTGMSCEDIHPEHTCCSGHCKSRCSSECHHHEDETTFNISDKCCSDDYHVLLLTGAVSDDGRVDDCQVVLSSSYNISNHVEGDVRAEYDCNMIRPPVHDIVHGRIYRPFLSIWRI